MNEDDIIVCKRISRKIIKNVKDKIEEFVGKEEAGRFVKIGADGTPTSFIDILAEEEVIKTLREADFYSYLISEEIGELKLGKGSYEEINLVEELSVNNKTSEVKYIFLVDPIDGTNNAIKNIPSYGISIAVAEVPKGRLATLDDVQYGIIKNLASGNIFEAIKGKGAKLNGLKQSPSNETDLTKISLGGFTKSKTVSASKLVDTARRMRVLGSVVLELSYIASGKYDAFLDLRGSRIIDIAASKLIVEESGGIITNKYGEKLNNKLSIYEKTVVVGASNETLHRKLIKSINDDETEIIRSVAVVSRVDEYKSILFSAKIIDYLLKKNITVSIESSLANELEKLKRKVDLSLIIKNTKKEAPEISHFLSSLNFNIDFKKFSADLKDLETDLAIILGGDGTLLRTQSQINRVIPIFGINMGTVGFLTEIEVNSTFTAINQILKGDYYKEKRSQLNVSHENHLFTALNEVVIMTDAPAKMLHFEITVDGEIVEEFRADGLIISTPSGSTAYSMSAGGPILDPKVGGFIIIPICPYKLGLRPFIVSDTSEIRVKLLKKGKKAIFVMDGQINKKVNYMEEIKFKKSKRDVTFVRTSNKYFYSKVKEKLSEGGINTEPRRL